MGAASEKRHAPHGQGWDTAGNLLTSTDANSVKSTYTYSVANELQSLTSSTNNSTNPPNVISNVQNGPNGPATYSLGNGLTVVNAYDSLGRFGGGWTCQGSSTHNCSGGTEIEGSLAAWHGTETTQVCEDNPTPNQCSNTGYDEFGRLTSFTTVSGTPNSYTYTYDRYGNRWTQAQTAGTGGPQPSLSFNTGTNQVSGVSYDGRVAPFSG